jgi:hypothetical protein
MLQKQEEKAESVVLSLRERGFLLAERADYIGR